MRKESILDKIIADIECLDVNEEYWGYYDAIDKYKEESEEQGNE